MGFVAAAMTSLSFVPQAVLVLRTGNTTGISLMMYLMFTLGVALWALYGISIKSWPVALANGLTLILALCILSVTLRNHIRAKRGD